MRPSAPCRGALLACLLALVGVLAPASASALAPAQPESRVWGFDLVGQVLVGGEGELSHGLRQGYGLEYGDVASASLVAPNTGSPVQLIAGRAWEEAELARLGQAKNTSVWRPLPEDMNSAAFKVIVGPAKYTQGGLPVGTTVDIAEAAGSMELKGGTKMMASSYQLRLQTYRALKVESPLTIRTTRPINPTFKNWLERWGVRVENPSAAAGSTPPSAP